MPSLQEVPPPDDRDCPPDIEAELRSDEELRASAARMRENPPDRFAKARELERAIPISVRRGKAEDTPARGHGRPLRELVMAISAESLRAVPPRRDYFLTTASGKGVMVRGRVAAIAAKGGTGKTVALLQLAVAEAIGKAWFGADGWETHGPGRVLIALAEEDREEVMRRLHHAARGADLEDAELAQVAGNISVLPLSGIGVQLTTELDGKTAELPETTRASELRVLLREAASADRPFSLVILDPLSRFAGGDTEKDNASATRFCQVVESLTAADCGAPTVLIAHHLRKRSGDDKYSDATSDLIRGASGLVDGVRWAAILDPRKRIEGAPELLELRVVKSNYAPTPDPLILCRPDDGHGCLRVATPGEVESYKEQSSTRAKASSEAKVTELAPQILKALAKRPASGTALAEAIGGRKDTMLDACRALEAEGKIRRQSGPASPWCLTAPVPKVVPGTGTDRQVPGRFPSSPPFRGEPEPELGGLEPEDDSELGTGTGTNQEQIGNEVAPDNLQLSNVSNKGDA